MRALFIGGTGTISMAITKLLVKQGWEVYLINRGSRNAELPDEVNVINMDINDEEAVKERIKDLYFDTVCDFIGFVPEQVERDFRIFQNKTNQYMYISSASAYHKPLSSYVVNEGTSLINPYWEYSRNKAECERYLMDLYAQRKFPVTIIRPSHTYDERSVPLGVHGKKGSWQVVKRIKEGKKVIIHGDGTSLWTITHNSDFAKAFVGLMANQHAIGEAFQITSGETVTWNQIYRAIADSLNVELKPFYVSSSFLMQAGDFDFEGSLIGDKANSVVFDNRKLLSVVPDFQAKITAAQGIDMTIKNVLKHPELQIEDNEFDEWCDEVIKVQEEACTMLRKKFVE